MRIPLPLILATTSVAVASAAFAYSQSEALDRLRMQTLQQQNMRAQAQDNALRRADADLSQALAEQHRRQTRNTIRSVELRGSAPSAPGAASSRLSDDEVALRRIQDRELDAGNARLRALAPAR